MQCVDLHFYPFCVGPVASELYIQGSFFRGGVSSCCIILFQMFSYCVFRAALLRPKEHPEDTERWREERRKNFPSSANLERKVGGGGVGGTKPQRVDFCCYFFTFPPFLGNEMDRRG